MACRRPPFVASHEASVQTADRPCPTFLRAAAAADNGSLIPEEVVEEVGHPVPEEVVEEAGHLVPEEVEEEACHPTRRPCSVPAARPGCWRRQNSRLQAAGR